MKLHTVVIAMLALIATAVSANGQCGSLQWTQMSNSGPQGRSGAAMVFDDARGVCVLFGGANGARLNDTWEWNGEFWSQRPTIGGIPGLWGAASVYDSQRHRMVLFGGASSTGELSGNTWEYDGATYSLRATTGPGYRNYMWQMAYDSDRGKTVLFGGGRVSGSEYGDTWEWDGNVWQQVATSGPPPGTSHGMAYDAVRHRTVMLHALTRETWEWDGTTWERRALTGPTVGGYLRLAWDSERQRIVGVGANLDVAGAPTETWEWDGSAWTQRSLVPTPARRSLHGIAFDRARGKMVVFGGFDGVSNVSDTWELDSFGGQPEITTQPPATLEAETGGWLSIRVGLVENNTLQYQWRKDGVALNDSERLVGTRTPLLELHTVSASDAGVYTCDVSNPCGAVTSNATTVIVWSQSACANWNQAAVPPMMPRGEFSMAFDRARGETLLFGGGGTSPGPNQIWGDTWILSADGWRQYNGPAPAARVGAALAFDDSRQRLVLFGGRGTSGAFLNDMWEWTGEQWVQIASSGVSGRQTPSLVFDSSRNRLLLIGGATFSSNWIRLADCYEWTGTSWTRVGDFPVGIAGSVAVYDRGRNEVVLFGGGMNNGLANGTTYVRRAGVWSVGSASGPSAVANVGVAYADHIGKVITFGGTMGNPDGETSQCWSWDGSQWSPLADVGRPSRRQTHGFVYDSHRQVLLSVFGWLNNSNTYFPEQWELRFAPPVQPTAPSSLDIAAGSPAVFHSSSPSATTHLWHRNGVPLTNNTRISGADTATLTITNSHWADQGAYTCLVSGNCGGVMSEPATLTITSCPPAWASAGIEDFGARWVHAQAYSGVNGGTLVFGGRNAAGATLGDTWLRTDSDWANVSTTGPSARTDHAMATLANGRVLLFGGKTDVAANASALGDTWEWNGSAWSLLSNTGPAARAGHSLAFDSARNRVILFGGLDVNGAALGDTWEWNGTAWTQAATTGPTPRFAHTTAYDPARRLTVLFGGFGPGLVGDTWEWDGTSWAQAATTGISARFYAAAAFDDSLGRVLLVGGSTGGSVLNDAYIWTGTAWQPRSFTASPTARWTHAMSYDAAARRMVVTGGAGTGATRFSDAWESSGRPMTTSVPPIALSRLAGDTVQFTTTVAGAGPFTLRWRKDGVSLFNSALYSGVTTPTLTINTTDPSQSGLYALSITSPCTSLTTTGTQLDIRCGADFNNDGAVDGDDVIGFFTAWDAGELEGDYNGDLSVDGDDVIGFFGRWDVGC